MNVLQARTTVGNCLNSFEPESYLYVCSTIESDSYHAKATLSENVSNAIATI